MQDFPEFGGQFSSKAAAKGAYRLGLRPLSQPNATFDDVLKLVDKDFGLGIWTGKATEEYKKITSAYKQPELEKPLERCAPRGEAAAQAATVLVPAAPQAQRRAQ